MFITRDARHIVLPFRGDVARLIPQAQKITYQGEDHLIIPNGHDEAKLCRNLGLSVPPPILTSYDWRGKKPWDIQKTTAALMSESPRAYILNSMGTGKTASTIWACDYLLRTSAAKRVLIAAPLSTLTPVWEKELFWLTPGERAVVLHGDRAKRLKLLDTDATWYIINHHGVGLLSEALIKRGFDIIVIDELAVFRNKSTGLWKAVNSLVSAPTTKFAWGLTGSPTPRAPTDAWAQVRLLTPSRVPRTMTFFRDQTMRQLSQFKWLDRPEAPAIVHRAMQPSVRFSRDDIEELPETSYVDRTVTLSNEAKAAYKMLMDKMRTMSASGSITAANEGVLQSKLLQVACGYVYTDAKGVYALPNSGRLTALEEVLNETDRQVLVFVPFVHALKGVADHLRKAGENIAMVYGETPRAQRDAIFTKFQAGTGARVIVAHPQTMAHGLTLTAANTIVWFSPINSLEYYEQANARITRPGQKYKTLIVHLTGTTVEKLTYARLKQRGRMQGLLLDLFAGQELVI